MPTAPSSGKTSRRTSRNFTQITLSPDQERELQLNAHHRRDHANAPSHQHPRRESSAQAVHASSNPSIASSITQSQRPPLKVRALSAPLVPKARASASAHNQLAEIGQDAPVTDPADEEIADDPFFQRYSFPHTEDAEEDSQESSPKEAVSECSPLSPPSTQLRPRPDSAAEPSESPMSPQSPRSWTAKKSPRMQLQEINIVVLGSPLVGKSTFIQRAFDLRTTPPTSFTSRKMSIDGNVYVVRLIELSYHELDLDDEKCICWPDVINGTPVPAVDGAFTLYDVTNKESLVQVPETLSGIYNASIPFLLVACKCDFSPTLRHVDPARVDKRAQATIGDVRTFQTSEAAPDTQKRCVAVLLRAIVGLRNQQLNHTSNRRRANSSATHQTPTMSPPLSKHHRANSEISANMYKNHERQKYRPEFNPPLSKRSQSHQNLPTRNGQNAFFEMDPATIDSLDRDLDREASPEHGKITKPQQGGTQETGFIFDELVNRLLAQPISKVDARFTSIFLALFRLFASPSQLLDCVVHQFDLIGRDNIPQTIMASAQQRHLNVLEQWISLYPGDFAYPITRRKMETFISRLASVRLFAAAARELSADLESVFEDDDTYWAVSDAEQDSRPTNGITKGMNGLTVKGGGTSLQSPISPLNLTSPIMSSSQSMLSGVEQATRQAIHLTPNGRFPLTKLQWHLLIDLPEEIIAREMTRMDWVMLSSIRPRDLVRHVSLKDAQKAKCSNLANVQRMIDHFNHVALWVANFVLLRDKPKHRSFMLEKMMKIARELRKMNNYNALGAVLAGINSSAVQRLHSTKEMIDPVVGKDFMKLEILMSPQKSHAAYRLAWENTSGERIPYIPLHRRDLVAASEGNRTFIGEDPNSKAGQESKTPARINWKKFEIMGDVVVGLQRAKEVAYPTFVRSDEVKSLVIDMGIEKDEDKLYERSQQVEPLTSGGNRRRFPWLQS